MTNLPPSLRRGTRRHVAQLINCVLHLAAFTGAIANHPLPRGWLPRALRAETVAKESLLPSEEAKMFAGRDAAGALVVPLAFRVLYAFFHRDRKRHLRVLRGGESCSQLGQAQAPSHRAPARPPSSGSKSIAPPARRRSR